MLDEYGPQPEKALKPCKPDYESMIKRAYEQLGKTEKFLSAIFDYHDNSSVRNKMAELVGELYSKKVELESSIESMIKQQEQA